MSGSVAIGVGVVEADFFFLRSRSRVEVPGDGFRFCEANSDASSFKGGSDVVFRFPALEALVAGAADVDETGLASRADVGVVPRAAPEGLAPLAELTGLGARPTSGLIARLFKGLV